MYGQGNYTAPMGKGPYTSTPFHQRPRPQAPPPPFSQGPHPPVPTMIQQGPLLVPPQVQVGQLGNPVYQHAPPGPPQQGPPTPVLSNGMNAQSYLTPPPPPPPPPLPQPGQVHGSSLMQQHLQWSHNATFIPPTGSSSAPRVFPRSHSQGQTLFSCHGHQHPAGSVQAPSQPHPSAASFYTSPTLGSFEHSMPQIPNTALAGLPPPPPPPPLPYSPPRSPPLPPSSPPPPRASCSPFSKSLMSVPIPAASESVQPQIGSRVNGSSGLEISASSSVDGVSAPYLVGDDVHKRVRPSRCDEETGSKTISTQGEYLSLDLPPPPPKPADDKTVRSIEVLCQYIAKNGPEFENMIHHKEFGNPEFKFLFGGEPGSEAAVAREYFVWTKRKYHLGSKSVEKQGSSDSSLIPSGGSSSQFNIVADISVPYSPADSDMDMEDDITHPDEESQCCTSNKHRDEIGSISNGLDKEHKLQPLLSTAECNPAEDAVHRNFIYSGLLGSGQQRQGTETSSVQNESVVRTSFGKVDGLYSNSSGDIDHPLVIDVTKTSSPHEYLTQPKTSADLAEVGLEKLANESVNQGTSPFRLLQDYASDESSDDEAHLVDAGVDIVSDLGTNSVLDADKGLDRLPQSFKSEYSSVKPESVMTEAAMASTTGKSENCVDFYGNQETLKDGNFQGELQQKIVSIDCGIDDNAEKQEDQKKKLSMAEVDEYGRLIRQGDSDSDPGASPNYNRRRGKRGRSRSRSRSPHDRRRKRSPWRRKERRSRSRSLSPKRRRSRSKSPPYRHGGIFGGDKMRRDKGQRPECFDFIRGKCYYGSSCRYLHHEDKRDWSRSYQSAQQFQDQPYGSRSSDFHEKFETPYKRLSREHDKGRTQELKPRHDLPSTEEKKDMKEAMDKAATQIPDKSGPLEPLVHPMPDSNMEKNTGDAVHSTTSPAENLEPVQSRSQFSDRFFPNADHQYQEIDTSSGVESLPIHKPVSSIPSQLPTDKTYLNEDSASRLHSNLSSMSKSFPPESIPSKHMVRTESIPPATDHLSHLPPFFPQVHQNTSSSFNQEMPIDYDPTSPAAKFPPHTASAVNCPPYQASVSYSHSQFSFPPNPSWNSLPPPPAQPHPQRPAFVNDMTLTPGPYSGPPVQFMQNMLPPMNDFSSQTSVRPYLTEIASRFSVGQNQPNRPPDHLDDLQPRTFPTSEPMNKSHGGPGLGGEDRFMGRSVPSLHPSNSFGQDNLRSQPLPFSSESPEKRIQAFPGENQPPADGVTSLHHEHGKLGSTLSRYTSDLIDKSQPSILTNFGLSRISSHFNPYASTFEQPLSLKISSNILVQEKDQPFSSNVGAAYGLSQVPGDVRAVASGSRSLMSPQNSARPLEEILHRPGDDQYDPLYDSIEPSLNSVRKSDYGQKREITDESDVMLRFSGSNKPLDADENKKLKGGGAAEVSGFIENEEYGETADAEVGAVENESPSDLNDAADMATGEVEIDQVKAPGKGKKSKDSRSMKLFKVALADFVKEVLKPSWRQGNMSKEAFKTIVKKTVDRVSGAMKSHQIPKSQAKINRYIDSSQRKLTKLVMGYVDKYVKV